jgi:hypothetical protein
MRKIFKNLNSQLIIKLLKKNVVLALGELPCSTVNDIN